MPREIYTLRKKLLVWLLVPLLILFTMRAVYNYYLSISLSNQIYDNAIFDLARSLKEQIFLQDGKPAITMSRPVYDILLSDQFDLMYFVVRDADGETMIGNDSIPLPPSWRNIKSDHQYYNGQIQNKNVRIVALRVPVQSNLGEQFILVQVAETLTKRHMLAHQIIEDILIPQIFIIILATAVIWFGVGKGLAPLQKLQSDVENRSHLDLSPIDVTGLPAEARPLILSINDLMERLDKVIGAQSRFIADAAHQLRTPLAGLLAQVGFALQQNNPETSKHCMEQIYISAERISRLVSQLLTLARNEPDSGKAYAKDSIELNQFVSETVQEWVPEALKKDIDLGFEGVDRPVKIFGDSLRLKEMINNLLDNAIRYTQAAGKVTARVSGNGSATISVEDNGPGIPLEEREFVFERFCRVLGNEADGSGLGLAIVRDIAQAHHANISLTNGHDGKGSVIQIAFT